MFPTLTLLYITQFLKRTALLHRFDRCLLQELNLLLVEIEDLQHYIPPLQVSTRMRVLEYWVEQLILEVDAILYGSPTVPAMV
jgi:hypothetical protein